MENPLDDVSCGPDTKSGRDDLLNWNAVFKGPRCTPYANGIYYVAIHFPPGYPMRAPSIRFDINKCKLF